MISAEIIADSLNQQGQRLTTFVLVFPRIVLAEFNTHRMLSRNSASSRAIPFDKMLKMLAEKPFVPIRWMKEHTGMQGSEYFTDEMLDGRNYTVATAASILWLEARDNAIKSAQGLSQLGVTKQFVNRLLEPYMYHKVIATGTEWENFFSLRADDPAEIHIQDLAYKMLHVYNQSTPKQLQPGEWHIPFGENITDQRLADELYHLGGSNNDLRIKIATARCARISYNTFEGKDDYEADIKLHDRLASSGHFSPFEHCAKAMTDEEYYKIDSICGDLNAEQLAYKESLQGWSGNFKGFTQYRKLFNNENRTDTRVTRKSPATANS